MMSAALTSPLRLALLLPWALLAACTTTEPTPLDGTCAVDDSLTASCNTSPDGGAPIASAWWATPAPAPDCGPTS